MVAARYTEGARFPILSFQEYLDKNYFDGDIFSKYREHVLNIVFQEGINTWSATRNKAGEGAVRALLILCSLLYTTRVVSKEEINSLLHAKKYEHGKITYTIDSYWWTPYTRLPFDWIGIYLKYVNCGPKALEHITSLYIHKQYWSGNDDQWFKELKKKADPCLPFYGSWRVFHDLIVTISADI